MKNILSLGLLALVITVAALTVAPLTLAQSVTPTEAQCETAKARLTTQLTKVEATKTAQTDVYTSIQTEFDKILTTAGQTAYDTAAMIAAQDALGTKLTAYADSSAKYSAALLAAKNTACSTTNTEFTSAINTARTALTSVRTATTDVRTTIRGEVTDTLKEYATWLKDIAETEEEK